MTEVIIRQAGAYTVTTDDEQAGLYVNGKSATFAGPSGALVETVDTGCRGANGKFYLVGLTAAQYAIYTDIRDALRAKRETHQAEARAAERVANAAYYDAREALASKAAAHDRRHNEGGEGYNPYRRQIGNLDAAHGRASAADIAAVLGRRDRAYPEGA